MRLVFISSFGYWNNVENSHHKSAVMAPKIPPQYTLYYYYAESAILFGIKTPIKKFAGIKKDTREKYG